MTDIIDIIQRFEKDMQFDAHGNKTKIARSNAAEALIEMGREALPQIATHLEANPPDEQLDIHICWGILLGDIAINLKVWQKPVQYKDTKGWIAWAKREAKPHVPN